MAAWVSGRDSINLFALLRALIGLPGIKVLVARR
ncbi:MAG: hypothetical protein ACI9M6_000205 [Hydrogenophaga sp.]|jgi:hypothetical protein